MSHRLSPRQDGVAEFFVAETGFEYLGCDRWQPKLRKLGKSGDAKLGHGFSTVDADQSDQQIAMGEHMLEPASIFRFV